MKRKKQLPNSIRPKRMPGHSIQEKGDQIFDIAILWIIAIAILGAMAMTLWIVNAQGTVPSQWPFTIAAIALAVGLGVWTYKSMSRWKNNQVGFIGEVYVGQKLEELAALGFKVLHDVPCPMGNIDHILIGQKGIYTIETKTRAKSNSNDRVTFDGKHLRVAGAIPDRDPIAQSMRQALWLHRLIEQRTGQSVFVRPVLVFPGWYVVSAQSNSNVWIRNENSLRTSLKSERETLTDKAVDQIYKMTLNVVRSQNT